MSATKNRDSFKDSKGIPLREGLYITEGCNYMYFTGKYSVIDKTKRAKIVFLRNGEPTDGYVCRADFKEINRVSPSALLKITQKAYGTTIPKSARIAEPRWV